MFDDFNMDGPEFNPPSAESVYCSYVETCRRLGVEPVSRDRAQGLMAEWFVERTARRSPLD
jgi:hypothetical protein